MTCHLNSAMNPIIYGVMNKKLRAAMFGIAPEWMSLPKLKSSVKPSSQDSSMEEGGASKASTEGEERRGGEGSEERTTTRMRSESAATSSAKIILN